MKRIKGKIDGIRFTANGNVELFVEGDDNAFYIPPIFVDELDEENINSYIDGNAIIRYKEHKQGELIPIAPSSDGTYPVVTTDFVNVRRTKEDGTTVDMQLQQGEAYQPGDRVILRVPKIDYQMVTLTKSASQLEATKVEAEIELLRSKMVSLIGSNDK